MKGVFGMTDRNKSLSREMERSLRLCISTYVNLYGVMPSTKEMCTQLGVSNEVAVAEYLHTVALSSLLATA